MAAPWTPSVTTSPRPVCRSARPRRAAAASRSAHPRASSTSGVSCSRAWRRKEGRGVYVRPSARARSAFSNSRSSKRRAPTGMARALSHHWPSGVGARRPGVARNPMSRSISRSARSILGQSRVASQARSVTGWTRLTARCRCGWRRSSWPTATAWCSPSSSRRRSRSATPRILRCPASSPGATATNRWYAGRCTRRFPSAVRSIQRAAEAMEEDGRL